MRQLLFERGCLESPTAKLTRPEAAKLLGNIWRKIINVRRRGHRAIMSPIAHPELAGNGIENTRGAFQRCTTGERTNKTDLRRVSTPSSNAFHCVVDYRVAQTAGTIVSMEWTKRLSSLDERETTLEYIEESTLLRVLSILSAFERRRRVIAVHSTKRLPSFPAKLKKHQISLTKPRRLLSVFWMLNSIRIQQQQRDCRY